MHFETIKRWVSDVFTEPDNNVICPVRIMAIGGFLYSIGVHAYSIVYQHAVFDLQQFSTAFGIMLATLGAALKMKTDSAPMRPDPK